MRDDRDLARALRRDLDRVRLPEDAAWIPLRPSRGVPWLAFAVALVAVVIIATIAGVAFESPQVARPPVASGAPSASAAASAEPTASASVGRRTVVPGRGSPVAPPHGR